jgi:[ribosomal protein S5]-alanine N-acetyltransferase
MYWGNGVVVGALEELIKLIRFESYGRCEVRNTASERVMQKVKMTYEGTLRQSVLIDGVYSDSNVYSLLKHEYDKF